MTKTYLENVIVETNQKLDDGIKVYLHDRSREDAIINGAITGLVFVVVSVIFQELRHAWTRHRNREWYKRNKEN